VYSAFRCSIRHKSLIIGKISYNCDKILIQILRKLHFIYQNKISGKGCNLCSEKAVCKRDDERGSAQVTSDKKEF